MAVTQRWTPPVGDILINRYRLDECLGNGATGVVYRAYDQEQKRVVAIKALHPDLLGEKYNDANRAILERATAYKQKGLAKIYETHLDEDGNCPPLVISEFITGVNLRNLCNQRRNAESPVSHPEIRFILEEVTEVLKGIHSSGIHGNLKPENIFVVENGIMVTDPYFLQGRTRLKWQGSSHPLRDHYLSAEQLMKGGEESIQSDIFSLGLIMGELVVGESVRPSIPLSDQSEDISELLDRCFLTATADAPIDRHRDLSVFLTEIDRSFPEKAKHVIIEDSDTQVVAVEDVLTPKQLAEIAAFNRARQSEANNTQITPMVDIAEDPLSPADRNLTDPLIPSKHADEDEMDRTVVEDPAAIAEIMRQVRGDESEPADVPSSIPGIPNTAADEVSKETRLQTDRDRRRSGGPRRRSTDTTALPVPPARPTLKKTEEEAPILLNDADLEEDMVPAVPEEVLDEEEALILSGEDESAAPGHRTVSIRPTFAPRDGTPDPRKAALHAAVEDASEAPTINATAQEVMAAAKSAQAAARQKAQPPMPPPPPRPQATPGKRKNTLAYVAVAVLASAVIFMVVLLLNPPTKKQSKGENERADREEQNQPVEENANAGNSGESTVAGAAWGFGDEADKNDGTDTTETATDSDTAKDSEAVAADTAAAEEALKQAEADRLKAEEEARLADEKLAALKAEQAAALKKAEEEVAKKKAATQAAAEAAKLKSEEEAIVKAEKAAAKIATKKEKEAAAKKKAEEKVAAAQAKKENAEAAKARKAALAEKRAADKAKKAAVAAEKKAATEARKEERARKRMEAAEERRLERERKREEAAAKKAARKAQREQERAARKQADAEQRAKDSEQRKKELAAEEASIAAMAPLPPANTSESRKCIRGMKLITRKETRTIGGRKVVQKTAYCIDYHEYPGRGKKPKVNVTWFKASSLCAAKGKRLCTSKEWKQGCGGRKYPYGKEWSASRCNTMNAAGAPRSLKSAGSSKKCKSSYGLYDMSGNAGEWTADKTVNGGNAGQDGESATCYRASKRSPSSSSPMIGFRCCADPE